MPLMVYPKVLFHPMFSIKEGLEDSLAQAMTHTGSIRLPAQDSGWSGW